jgi:hypothetical protein
MEGMILADTKETGSIFAEMEKTGYWCNRATTVPSPSAVLSWSFTAQVRTVNLKSPS